MAARLIADPIAWLTAERVNLLAAVQQACQSGRLDLARQLASCQGAFWHYQDRYDDAERQWRAIADICAPSDDQTAAYARLRVAASMVRRGQAAVARPILDQCIDASDRGGQPAALALALYWRSICALDLDDPGSARSTATRGIAVAQRTGTRMAEYMNLTALGHALAKLGEADQAIQAGESALAIASARGIASYELEALLNLSFTYTLTGRHEPAVTACARAIEVSRTLGDICAEALAHGMLGDAYYGLGRYQQAAASLQRALPVFRDRSARHFQAVCLLKLGYAHQAMGSQEATRFLEQSLHIFRQLQLPARADQARQALAEAEELRTAAASGG